MALWFPRLPTDRLQRRWTRQDAQQARTDGARSPDAANEAPLVVVAKIDNAMRLTAVDRKATSLGLCAGMTLADSRAMLPALKVMAANEPADKTLLEQIAEWCDRYTPFVALDPPHALLDVTGVDHLFGGEKHLLDQIRSDLSRQGFAVRGALAGTAAAARAMARYKNGAVIPPGEEAKAVAPLPIEALRLESPHDPRLSPRGAQDRGAGRGAEPFGADRAVRRRDGVRAGVRARSRRETDLSASSGVRHHRGTSLRRTDRHRRRGAEKPAFPGRSLWPSRTDGTRTRCAPHGRRLLSRRRRGAAHRGGDGRAHTRSSRDRAALPREAGRARRSAGPRVRLRSHSALGASRVERAEAEAADFGSRAQEEAATSAS